MWTNCLDLFVQEGAKRKWTVSNENWSAFRRKNACTCRWGVKGTGTQSVAGCNRCWACTRLDLNHHRPPKFQKKKKEQIKKKKKTARLSVISQLSPYAHDTWGSSYINYRWGYYARTYSRDTQHSHPRKSSCTHLITIFFFVRFKNKDLKKKTVFWLVSRACSLGHDLPVRSKNDATAHTCCSQKMHLKIPLARWGLKISNSKPDWRVSALYFFVNQITPIDGFLTLSSFRQVLIFSVSSYFFFFLGPWPATGSRPCDFLLGKRRKLCCLIDLGPSTDVDNFFYTCEVIQLIKK